MDIDLVLNIYLAMDAFTLLEVERAISGEMKPRVPLWLEHCTPSYNINSVSFPLRYTEFYCYIRDNLERVFLMFTYLHGLKGALIATVKYVIGLFWNRQT